ncbi:hypothetical protein ACTG9Q_18865 [Actinokineospora sp. 24-640]
MLGSVASATTVGDLPLGHSDDSNPTQLGLVNLNNTDVLHNVNAVVGVCDNNINVLGVQVPVEDVANGISVPLLSPGEHELDSEVPDLCAAGDLVDGGSSQG